MFPDGVEKIVMTKEDYDRSVEQLLYQKISAEIENKMLHSIIRDTKEYIKNIKNKKIIDLNWEIEELLKILDGEGD